MTYSKLKELYNRHSRGPIEPNAIVLSSALFLWYKSAVWAKTGHYRFQRAWVSCDFSFLPTQVAVRWDGGEQIYVLMPEGDR